MKNKQKFPDNLIYGRHPILEALDAGTTFDKLFLQKGVNRDFQMEVTKKAKAQNLSVQVVPIEKLNRITRKNHQGVLGFAALIPYYDIADVLAKAYEDGQMPLFVLCDGITDVRNFGAMARTAACTGAQAMVITARGSVAINAEALKSSAGALHKIAVCKVRFLEDTIKYLKTNGVQIVATSLKTNTYLQAADLSGPTAIVMGAEGKGVSPKFLKMADEVVKIPIQGTFDSYNVSVATGMMLYEAMRQRLG